MAFARLWSQLEDGPAASKAVDKVGRAPEIARAIDQQSGLGNSAVRVCGEVVEDGFVSGRIQFENNSIAARAAVGGGAVNIAGRIEGQVARTGSAPVSCSA